MDWVHKSMSPQNRTPHTTDQAVRSVVIPPERRRSRAASTASTGRANTLRARVAVAGVVPAKPRITADADTNKAPRPSPDGASRS
jgi:hypothetical protein